jgi:hypothetical protein
MNGGDHMKISTYKYNPTDFTHVLGLSNDLTVFYNLHGDYVSDKTQRKRFALEKHGEDLFFTIKHRALEGAITGTTAYELREHMEELLYAD